MTEFNTFGLTHVVYTLGISICITHPVTILEIVLLTSAGEIAIEINGVIWFQSVNFLWRRHQECFGDSTVLMQSTGAGIATRHWSTAYMVFKSNASGLC